MNGLRVLVLGLFLVGVVGCGGGDPNKNLKPVDPNAPRPQVGSEGGGGGAQGGAEKPATPP